MNAPVSIDGGGGFNKVVILGSGARLVAVLQLEQRHRVQVDDRVQALRMIATLPPIVTASTEPSIEEMSKEAGISMEETRRVMKISKHPISLDRPVGSESDTSLGDMFW